MADDLDKEYAALVEKAPLTPTPEEEAAGQVEQEQAAFEAEGQGEQPQGDKSADHAQGAADANKDKPAAGATPEKKDELPLDEIKKRWEDQKGATSKERQARRAAEARAEQAEVLAQQTAQQLNALIAQLQAGQKAVPNPDEDVVGTVKALQERLDVAQRQQQFHAQQQAALAQQNRVVQTIQHKVSDFEAEFKTEHPDYDEALEYVLDLKESEFEAVGASKEQAQKAAADWAMRAAFTMLNNGVNPAQAGYQQALKLGFKPKGQQTGAAAVDPAAQAATKTAQDAAQKLQNIKDGQNATGKMSGGGGGSGFDGSLKSIGNLQGAAFDAAAEKFLRQMTRG